jgi:hypothetical protein
MALLHAAFSATDSFAGLVRIDSSPAYFAASTAPEKDGAIWALDPYRFNVASVGVDALLNPNSHIAAPVFRPPFQEGAPAVERVIAIHAREMDLRMMVQHAAFTIHGHIRPLEQEAGAPSYLARYLVPAATKRRILAELRMIGIKKSTLFPDLESLADDLVNLPWKFERGAPATNER